MTVPGKLRCFLVFAGTLLLLLLTIPLSLTGGTGDISLLDAAAALFNTGNGDPMVDFIVRELRLPRLVLALLAGSALGISGAILQSVLRNVLVSPDLLGISSGGGCAGLIIMLWFPQLSAFTGVAVFAGALTVALLVYLAAWKRQLSRTRLLLAGVAIGAIFSTASTAMLMLMPERYGGVFNFLLGGFSGRGFEELKYFIPGFVITFAMAGGLARKLDIAVLGDTGAASLGLPVERIRFLALATAALGAASAAGIAGLLGFAGLIAPHTVRFLGKSGSHRFLLPCSALAGAELVLLGDWLGRVLPPEPLELPAGIFLAGCGALFFLILLLVERREGL